MDDSRWSALSNQMLKSLSTYLIGVSKFQKSNSSIPHYLMSGRWCHCRGVLYIQSVGFLTVRTIELSREEDQGVGSNRIYYGKGIPTSYLEKSRGRSPLPSFVTPWKGTANNL